MNVFLIPYTPWRHLSMALWLGCIGLVTWWVVLFLSISGPNWAPSADGYLLLGSLAATIGGGSMLGECNLRRLKLRSRIWRVLLAGGLSLVFALIWLTLWQWGSIALLEMADLPEYAANAGDPSLASLTYRVGAFGLAGFASALGPLAVRRANGIIAHSAGGFAAGLAASALWFLMSYGMIGSDFYFSGAAVGLVWGFVHGMLVWGIPDSLYAGWLRVLTPSRYGLRIPVDGPEPGAKERFVGHFPRGLDMYHTLDDGVMELHVSVAVDAEQKYTARGLSLQPSRVKRMLETIDLSYDSRRPAPLETLLQSGDQIIMGEGEQNTVLEFVMLPREER